MATLIVTAPVGDAPERRRMRARVLEHLRVAGYDVDLTDHLVAVVWELLLNVDHVDPSPRGMLVVEVTERTVLVRVPGPPFDSISAATKAGAHGLDTVRRRLESCGWRWLHRYVQVNEIHMEELKR